MPRRTRTPADETPADPPIAAAAADPAEGEVEIPIGGAPAPSQAAEELIQELEVEVRNQSEPTTPSLQQLALDLLRLARENAERLGSGAVEQLQSVLKGGASDYLDPDFWRGLGMVLDYQVNEIRGLIQRRVKGEYSTDAYGRDDELIELARPLASFLYRSWWRVRAIGLEHVPAEGGALLVANHAGVLPWDGAMLATAVLEDHGAPRLTRTLHQRWMSGAPLLAPSLAAMGQVPALPENAERLLAEGELVSLFPEGVRGAAKIFRKRYQLAEFDAEGYLSAALRTGAPVIPVAVIGSEETYPVLLNLDKAARLLGLPYLPITPLFPWAGLLGLVPLPSRWVILFGAPLDTAGAGPEQADDSATLRRLGAELRQQIEALIQRGLAERGSAFLG
jgi:1-acyl-sn-glycerol-3-phosphate acyltransferase